MNKIGNLLISIGILSLVISLFIFIYNNEEEEYASIKSQEVLSIIKNNQNDKQNKTLIENSIKEMQTITINGIDYIGTISIPRMNIELPIISDYSYDKLKISPCRYYGDVYTNDLIICGHSYKSHFKKLNYLKQGDIIIFTDIFDNNYTYEVKEIEILKPKEVSKMINNNFDLTLFTCTNDGFNRITIRCNKIFSAL